MSRVRIIFFIHLGGVAGLLGIILALVQAFKLTASFPTLDAILQVLPNLAAILWLLGIYAFQLPQLGRLGSLGLVSAAIGLLAIIVFGLLEKTSNVSPSSWVNALLSNPAIPWVFTGVAVSYVWGILALGTESLQAGVLPKGAVVLWMVGLEVSLVSNWPPIRLVVIAGIVWTSVLLLRGNFAKESAQLSDPECTALQATRSGSRRLIPLDALRGTIMVLMAIDHASYFIRRWHPFETWDQPLPDYPNLAALLTRLATHPCAPGFFFLMGAGMILFAHARRQVGWSEREIAGHLALRGLLFIALEQLIVDVAIAGQVNPFEFSILSGLGAAMLFGILFLRLSGLIQAVAGAAIILIMQFLPGLLLLTDLGIFNWIRLLILPGPVGIAFVLYPPIPWLGVVLLGMAFARLLLWRQDKAYQLAGIMGLVCLALFPLVRAAGGFGNLRMPAGNTLVDFFNLVKYPPSLSFLLLTLGVDLVLLYVFSRISLKLDVWGKPIVVFGQAALYFFLTHWFIYGAMGLVWSTPGGLPKTYLAWAIGLILLYPICKTYEAFKHKMPVNSIWRML